MDEKMLILKMLENGKITAEDAYKLLAALDGKKEQNNRNKTNERHSFHNKKTYLSITLEKETGEKSNVRIPISIARMGLNAGSKFSTELNGLNINEIINSLEQNGEAFVVNNGKNETIILKLV